MSQKKIDSIEKSGVRRPGDLKMENKKKRKKRMKFSTECQQLFGTNDLYKIFQLDKGSSNLTDAKVKKAYYQLSILWHPDRFASEEYSEVEREVATKKFQVVGRCYQILSDKEKRTVYDQTGSLDDDEDDGASMASKDWTAVWRGMFREVTKKDIDAYLTKFRGSEEEMEDVKQAYLKHKGSMDKILDTVVGADVHNEDRIREIIRHYIAQGEVQPFARFVNEPPSARAKRMKRAEREAKEAEQVLKEMQQKEGKAGSSRGGGGADGDLVSLILARQKKRGEEQEDFLAHLAQKYGGKNGGGDGEPKKKKTRKN